VNERLLLSARWADLTWVEFAGDWGGLYRGDDLIWQGHPGDFEWAYHTGIETRYPVSPIARYAPDKLSEVPA